MPIYEFQCRACGKITEVMQKVSDAPLEKCPECGGEVGKKMSLTSFTLKGTGWYATDYKKSSAPAASTPPAEPGKAASAEKPETAKPANEPSPAPAKPSADSGN